MIEISIYFCYYVAKILLYLHYTLANLLMMNVNKYAKARRLKGISQQELADAAECSKRTIGYLEHGKKINFLLLKKIEQILHTQLRLVSKI